MNQEEWSKMYLDKDKPYDFWDDPENNKTEIDDLTKDLQGYMEDEKPEQETQAFGGLRLKQDTPAKPVEQYRDKSQEYDEFLANKEMSNPYGNYGTRGYVAGGKYIPMPEMRTDDYTARMNQSMHGSTSYVSPAARANAYNPANGYAPSNVAINRTRLIEKNHLPIVTVMIILANVIAYVLCMRAGKDHVLTGGINYEYITRKHEYGRFVSYMFLHGNFEHIVNNMVFLWIFGHEVEKRLGSLRMMIIYFTSGIGAGIGSTFVSHAIRPGQIRYCVGASGAVFGIICAFMFIDKMSDGKAKRSDLFASIAFVVVFAIISMSANVDIYGHIFGAIIGGIAAFLLNVKKWEDYKENNFMKYVGVVICLWFCIMGIGEANIGEDVKNLPDSRVDFIKEQSIFVESDDVTYGEGLAFYCTNCEWKAFTSTGNEDIVQFDGKTYYKGQERELVIQFILDVSGKDFTICYFAFDDEAQNGSVVNDYFTLLCNRYRSGL